ncbi:MAG: O-antigen ligase family protein [Planctomycetota bacterium]|jgi:O-antigen ligase
MTPTDRNRHWLQGIARGSVLAAAIISPWLFGSAEPWAYLLICILVGVGGAAWLVDLIGSSHPTLRAPRLTAALIGLLALVAFQMVPLPSPLVHALSPGSAQAQLARQELFRRAEMEEFTPVDVRERPGLAVMSASGAATRRSFYLLAAYVIAFLVLSNTVTNWDHLRRAAAAIGAAAFAMVVVALMQKFSGTRNIFWFHEPRFGGDIFGPFTNRNHFAAHINMTLGLVLGLLIVSARTPGSLNLRTWREKVAWLSTARAGQMALLLFATVLMAASVCVTLSRAGMASLVVALGIVGAVATARKALPRPARIFGAICLLILAAVTWLGWRPVVQRLGTLAEVAQRPLGTARLTASVDALRVFGAWPLFGCGFGSFQHVFPIFQSPSIQFGRWLHAHNDYAQVLAEGGLIGALLVVLAAYLFADLVVGRFRRAPATGRLMTAGMSVGLLAIGLHSLFDYGLHKPANALLLATVCGLSVAAVHLRGKGRRSGTKRETDEHGNTPAR